MWKIIKQIRKLKSDATIKVPIIWGSLKTKQVREEFNEAIKRNIETSFEDGNVNYKNFEIAEMVEAAAEALKGKKKNRKAGSRGSRSQKMNS